jgi:arginyl-tRNA synthetase
MYDRLSGLTRIIEANIRALYGLEMDGLNVELSPTRKEFSGHYTYVVFPLVRMVRKKPEDIADEIGQSLKTSHPDLFSDFNVIKGFLNLVLSNDWWIQELSFISSSADYGTYSRRNEKILVEYCSPNTNKPIHLGHIRNILLGWSAYKILEAYGYDVLRVQIINDRGIAICKSMCAWQLFGDGKTPDSEGRKGDFFVGDYYRMFEQRLAVEYKTWQGTEEAERLFDGRPKKEVNREAFFKSFKNIYFNEYSDLGSAAKKMLRKWEEGDEATMALWNRMNSWVYQGFNETFERLGVTFDHLYYESDTYLLGKEFVVQGLAEGTFYREEDGSVWVDLEDAGLDKKILLRNDGTSVYMTQDLGTAHKRWVDHRTKQMVYVVADEQDYHFQVLFEILKKLNEPYAEGLHHLSYGMVDLPSGRMKSREGTVVDADDLIDEVIGEVRSAADERGELEDLSEDDREVIYRNIGLAALKFFILKVNPQKRMVFNPKESVDIQGQTGPYIQNAYVRIRSIIRKSAGGPDSADAAYTDLDPQEIGLIQSMMQFPEEVEKAAQQFDPSTIANYAYDLARRFHRFYHDIRILNAPSVEARIFRLKLCTSIAQILEKSMNLLGIHMPERM